MTQKKKCLKQTMNDRILTHYEQKQGGYRILFEKNLKIGSLKLYRVKKLLFQNNMKNKPRKLVLPASFEYF